MGEKDGARRSLRSCQRPEVEWTTPQTIEVWSSFGWHFFGRPAGPKHHRPRGQVGAILRCHSECASWCLCKLLGQHRLQSLRARQMQRSTRSAATQIRTHRAIQHAVLYASFFKPTRWSAVLLPYLQAHLHASKQAQLQRMHGTVSRMPFAIWLGLSCTDWSYGSEPPPGQAWWQADPSLAVVCKVREEAHSRSGCTWRRVPLHPRLRSQVEQQKPTHGVGGWASACARWKVRRLARGKGSWGVEQLLSRSPECKDIWMLASHIEILRRLVPGRCAGEGVADYETTFHHMDWSYSSWEIIGLQDCPLCSVLQCHCPHFKAHRCSGRGCDRLGAILIGSIRSRFRAACVQQSVQSDHGCGVGEEDSCGWCYGGIAHRLLRSIGSILCRCWRSFTGTRWTWPNLPGTWLNLPNLPGIFSRTFFRTLPRPSSTVSGTLLNFQNPVEPDPAPAPASAHSGLKTSLAYVAREKSKRCSSKVWHLHLE